MRIALCDDELASIHMLQELIQAFCRNRKLELTMDLFSSGEDFLASAYEYDIVFMDVFLTGLSGIEAVRQSDHSRYRQIVFTTISREYAIDAFGLNATHYLLKPLTAESVAEAMERCLTRLGQGAKKVLSIKTSQGVVVIPMERIILIEVFNKLCIVRTRKGEFRTYTSLDALSEQLDASFLRIQRSYTINMKFVETFLFDRVIMQNGMEIMLSRNNRAELKEQYQRFLWDLARRGDV